MLKAVSRTFLLQSLISETSSYCLSYDPTSGLSAHYLGLGRANCQREVSPQCPEDLPAIYLLPWT